MHAQAHAANRRARRNATSNVKDKHRPANVALTRHAREKVKTGAITAVAISGNVLIERIVFARVNIDSRRAR
jgi:hypothetical protein